MQITNISIHIVGILVVGVILFLFFTKHNNITYLPGHYQHSKDPEYVRDSKSPNAEGVIGSFIPKDPSETKLFIKGIKEIDNGNLLSAESTFKSIVRIYPGEPEGYHCLGTTYLFEQKYDEAIVFYNKALEIDSNRALTFSSLGAVAGYQNKRHKAIKYYTRALQLEPNLALAHYGIANNLVAIDSFSQAVLHFQKVIELIPKSKLAAKSKTSIGKINAIYKEMKQ